MNTKFTLQWMERSLKKQSPRQPAEGNPSRKWLASFLILSVRPTEKRQSSYIPVTASLLGVLKGHPVNDSTFGAVFPSAWVEAPRLLAAILNSSLAFCSCPG